MECGLCEDTASCPSEEKRLVAAEPRGPNRIIDQRHQLPLVLLDWTLAEPYLQPVGNISHSSCTGTAPQLQCVDPDLEVPSGV